MVKLVCYNIEYCEGMKGHWYEYLKIWRKIFPPKGLDQKIVEALNKLKLDILALVEINASPFGSKKNEIELFSKKLKMRNNVDKTKYSSKGLFKLFHYIPVLNKQENAIISKYKISGEKYHILNEGMKRTVIEASINCPKKVTLLLVHLSLGKKARSKQIEELVKIVNEVKGPVILMGDFNSYKGDFELDSLIKKTRLEDKHKLDKNSNGFTEPTYHPFNRLDYILTSPQIKVKKYSVLKYPFSDHLPLFIDFTVE